MRASTRNSIFIQYLMRIQTFTDVQNTHTPAGMLQIKMRYTMNVLSYAKSFRLNNFLCLHTSNKWKTKKKSFSLFNNTFKSSKS